MLKNKGLIFIGIGAVIFSALASALSAVFNLDYFWEYLTYWLCFFCVLGCALKYSKGRSQTPQQVKILACLLLGIVFIFASCGVSNRTFKRWKILVISTNDWKQAVADLQSISQRTIFPKGEDHVWIKAESLPKSFDVLGNHDECHGAHLNHDACPLVSYGTKSRTWGLVITSNNLTFSIPPTRDEANRYWVATNAFFFVGTHY